MRLIHFSKKETLELRSATQGKREGAPFKPNGLWVSDENSAGWSQWCKAEDWGIGENEFTIEIKPDANVLMLKTDAAILSFSDRFQFAHDDGFGLYIDWEKVAREFQGIVITPYSWALRLDQRCNWYYGWDCASGCFWDADAIEIIEKETVT